MSHLLVQLHLVCQLMPKTHLPEFKISAENPYQKSGTINRHDSRQGNHLSGTPGNVREFDSCQGNVWDFTKSRGNVMEKILSGKSCLKLFIVSCMFESIQVFSMSLFYFKY